MLASAAAPHNINICVVLGIDNHTSSHLHFEATTYGHTRTSDQEQWATEQATADISTMLATARSPFMLNLQTLFAGADADSDAATAAIKSFATNCSRMGAGAFIGGYMSDRSLITLLPTLWTLGLTVLMPASGLPSLPGPRANVLRFWPSDEHQAKALRQRVVNVTGTDEATVVGTLKHYAQTLSIGVPP